MTRVKEDVQTTYVNGIKHVSRSLVTPFGTISEHTTDGWRTAYLIKTPADYHAMQFVVENTELELDDAIFSRSEENVGNQGLTLVRAARTPYQQICVDFAGLETLSYHLVDAADEVQGLYEAIERQVISYYNLIARSSAKFIQMPENLTSSQTGPKRFSRYHLPILEKITSILHKAEKRVVAHCDGAVSCLASMLAVSGLDGIESFTLPPEGDMTLEQARLAWPDMIIWNNIRLSDYNLQPDELTKIIQTSIRQGAVDGRLLLFGISEDLPPNWFNALPVILDAIRKS
jgi:hypothetical protein